jgi:hypothetical protein
MKKVDYTNFPRRFPNDADPSTPRAPNDSLNKGRGVPPNKASNALVGLNSGKGTQASQHPPVNQPRLVQKVDSRAATKAPAHVVQFDGMQRPHAVPRGVDHQALPKLPPRANRDEVAIQQNGGPNNRRPEQPPRPTHQSKWGQGHTAGMQYRQPGQRGGGYSPDQGNVVIPQRGLNTYAPFPTYVNGQPARPTHAEPPRDLPKTMPMAAAIGYMAEKPQHAAGETLQYTNKTKTSTFQKIMAGIKDALGLTPVDPYDSPEWDRF